MKTTQTHGISETDNAKIKKLATDWLNKTPESDNQRNETREYELLKEELAVAKSQIENHDATLAQVRLNERHIAKRSAQRLADALKRSLENPTSNQARFEGFQALDAWKEGRNE